MVAGRYSEARQRLVETASRIFYAEGIHAVGVDRLVTESGVTKATFYRHFPAKEDLVVAHVEYQAQLVRTAVEEGRKSLLGMDALTTFFSTMAGQICGAGFRGCPFINAAAEYPDPDHPVRRAIQSYRQWLERIFVELLVEAGHPAAEPVAAALVLLRDGAMVSGYLDDAEATQVTLHGAVVRLVDIPKIAG